MKPIKEMTWNEYKQTFLTDEMYFLKPDGSELYVVTEGTGDNLLEEDEEEGYVDYWVTNGYDISNEKAWEDGDGMWMETELICERNYTIPELIERVKEFDAPNDLDKWLIQLPDVGEKIRERIDDLEYKRWLKKVEETKKRLRSE